MSLPKSKWGNCSQCSATNTAVVKVKKDLFCLFCHNNNKSKQQLQRSKDRDTLRGIGAALKSLPQNKELVQNKTELDRWFAYVATIIKANPHCWNCGEFIPEQYYRHASAHIFPKAHFLSVSVNPLNFLVLGAGCGCHSKFDSSIDKAANMKVWGMAVNRFKSFENNITETHKYLDLFKSKINDGGKP